MQLEVKQIVPLAKKYWWAIALAIAILFGRKILNMCIRLLAMQKALTQDGVKESGGANKGAQVESYLKSVGLGGGYSWCMAFVYWNYQQVSKQFGIPNPLKATGGVLAQWNAMPEKYKKQKPSIGSIFIMDYGDGRGHTGIVTQVNADGTVNTIEGNTNSGGSRDGDGVWKRRRKQSSIKGYITIA